MRPIISEETRAVTRAIYLLYDGIPERVDAALELYFTECVRFPSMQVQTFLNRHPEFRPADWGITPEERAIIQQFGPAAPNRPKKPQEGRG